MPYRHTVLSSARTKLTYFGAVTPDKGKKYATV